MAVARRERDERDPGQRPAPSAMRAGALQADRGITPREVLQDVVFALFRHKWLIVTVFLVVVCGVCGYTYVQYGLYHATVDILVHENPQPQLLLFGESATPAVSLRQTDPAKNLMEISRTTEIARQVVNEFGLAERAARRDSEPEGAREVFWYGMHRLAEAPVKFMVMIGVWEDKGPKYEYDAVLQLLEERQDVNFVRDTEIVTVGIWEEDPELACRIANRMSELVIEKTIAMAQTKASAAYKFAKEQARVAQQDLQQIESRLVKFKAEHHLVSGEDQQRLWLGRLDTITGERDSVLAEVESLRSRLAELKRQLEKTPERISSSSTVTRNPLLAGSDEDRAVSEQETTMANPLHQELTSQAATTEIDLEARIAHQLALEDQIADMQSELAQRLATRSELERLEREKSVQESLYLKLKSKVDQLEVQQLDRLGEFDIRVVDAAYLPSNASKDWPKWKVSGAVACVAGLVLAILAALVVHYFDDTCATPRAVERQLAVPVLGTVPAVKRRRKQRTRTRTRSDGS